MTSKQRVHAAIKGQSTDRVPVTPIFMAWAAHFIGKTYRDYYLDGDVLVQSHLAVAKAFGIDQLSAISDPWREAEAYGMELDYPPEGVGIPKAHLLQSPEDVAKLRPLDPDAAPRMAQRIKSVGAMVRAAGQTHSVLGWVEGPLAEYADLRGVQESMLDLMDDPAVFHRACEVIVPSAIAFATAQIRAGADIIGVGDAACSLIGQQLYVEQILPWHKKLFRAIHDAGALVKLHICGNISTIIGDLATTGADAIDVDWMVPLEQARKAVGPSVCLCGNFDPAGVLLMGKPQTVADAARACIAAGGQRFILQPGCEVPPSTPKENIAAFCPGEGSLIADALRK